MPYGGTTSLQDKKIERCVNDKMADPDFKPAKGRTKKLSAILICKSAVMGTTKWKKKK